MPLRTSAHTGLATLSGTAPLQDEVAHARGARPLGRGDLGALESIRSQVEEGSGKVDPSPSPPGTEPTIGVNPSGVDVDLLDAPQWKAPLTDYIVSPALCIGALAR